MDPGCSHDPQAIPDLPPKDDLLAQGWVRRFVADPIWTKEALVLYPRMGYEVRAEPVSPADVGAECATCPTVTCSLYHVIYTRRKE